MRWLLRLLAGLAALAVVATIALAVALPRLARRPELREAIARAARDATGRELRFGALEAGILPPRLEVASPELVAASGEPPLRAERIALRLALLPLLGGSVAVDSLEVEGADLTVTRTAKGVELPVSVASGAEPEAPAPEGGIDVSLRELRVARSRLALVDRSVSPPVTWQLEDVEARARGRLLARDVRAEVDARLASGGRVLVDARRTGDGEVSARVKLDAISLAAAGPYLPAEASAAGTATLELELAGPVDALSGPVALELEPAALGFGDAFRKPAGERARVVGTLALEGGNLALRDGRLLLRDLDTPLAVATSPALRVTLGGGALDLAGWEAVVPALAGLGLSGRVSFSDLVVGVEPLSVTGRLALDGVALPLGEGQQASLSMPLEATGDAIRGAGPVRIAGQEIALDLGVDGLARSLAVSLGVRAQDLDSGALAVAFGAPQGSVSGPLDLEAQLRAPLGGETAPLDALSGPLRFEIAPGRLPGVSLLRRAVDALGGIGAVAALFAPLGASGALEGFYGDEFERAGGSFQIRGGRAHTEDLALLYRSYRVDLAGDIRLADTALDLEGKLTIFEEIDRAIRGAARRRESGGEARLAKRELPLAHVGGTASDPKVSLSPAGAVAFAGIYLGAAPLEGLRQQIDERVPGAGGIVDSLQGLFGPKDDDR